MTRSPRRSGAVLLLTGIACLVGAGLPVLHASAEEDDPGSGFGFFNLAANAPVVQVREDYATSNCSASPAGTAACEGVLNETVSTLRNGPIGHALASVGWPGTLGGNLGSLILVAQPGAPQQVAALNDPIRAENFTSGKEDTVTNTTVPGTLMTATATAAKVAASASIGQSETTGLGSFGKITSDTSINLTGPAKAEVKAHSLVQDIDLGVLHLGAVTSTATGTTNGTVATASGKTVVTGATVNGVPITIDEHGISVDTQNVPFPAQVTEGVNSALSQAGMTVLVSAPSTTKSAGDVEYNAGSLVLVWKQQGAGTMTVMIGGAQLSLKSTPSVDFGGGDQGGTTGDLGVGTTGTLGTGGAPLVPGTPGFSGEPPATAPLPSSGPAPEVVTAASNAAMPHGLPPWAGLLGGAGAVLLMAGLRRLPDRVLEATSTDCPNGELA